jgi:elongation factor Ts
MSISVEQIKSLRAKTGLGIHDVKKALEDAGGDEAKAIELLKEKGMSVMAKRADRSTGQGVIDCYTHGGRIGALIEVNCETDFVSRNEDFRAFVHDLVLQVASMKPDSVDELLAQESFKEPGQTIQELLTQQIAKTGENIKINRITRFELGE